MMDRRRFIGASTRCLLALPFLAEAQQQPRKVWRIGYLGITPRAAKDATSTIPIVMVSGSDPVGRGFVVSLAHRGGNITGISDTQVDLIPKRLELLKAAVPPTSRIVSLNYPGGFDAARLAATRTSRPRRPRC